MRLNEFLHRDFMLRRLEATDMEGVVAEIARKAADAGLGDEATIRGRLLERERLHPTVMGSGLAIPHAIIPGLDAPVVGVALTGGAEVPFGSQGQEKVRLFFVLLSPPGHEGAHVKLLARVCRLLRHEGFLESLEAAPDAARIIEIIEAVDALHA